ncbi:uncharacterized protein LOC135391585 [Ornithodoros turicata]|uniref:uncharacterized protein LOC135391585 n=1 Tax=Ornithodoros turicata TaxID=34597 RepID=UPI00313A4C00
MGRVSETLASLFVLSVVSEVIYRVYVHFCKRKPLSEVLFFPDSHVTCSSVVYGMQCAVQNCGYSHEETSLKRLLNVLDSSRRRLDVCVYLITCDVLGDAILRCHKRGRIVRVITDSEGSDSAESQVGKLRAEGVRVRTNNRSSFLMHHKFAVVDSRFLVSGSFNWTRQAITGNHENLLLTEDPHLVQMYEGEFQRLWELLQWEPSAQSP